VLFVPPIKKKKATPAPAPAPAAPVPTTHVVRGCFDLGNNDKTVTVTANADFLLYIWARNLSTFHGGIDVLTPPSQFRGRGSTGPTDVLVMDVPPQTGTDLGCIGGQSGEAIVLSSVFSADVLVFLTVVTAPGGKVTMTRT
jgi:hypothetical protein